jgi:hypothetical protein
MSATLPTSAVPVAREAVVGIDHGSLSPPGTSSRRCTPSTRRDRVVILSSTTRWRRPAPAGVS